MNKHKTICVIGVLVVVFLGIIALLLPSAKDVNDATTFALALFSPNEDMVKLNPPRGIVLRTPDEERPLAITDLVRLQSILKGHGLKHYSPVLRTQEIRWTKVAELRFKYGRTWFSLDISQGGEAKFYQFYVPIGGLSSGFRYTGIALEMESFINNTKGDTNAPNVP